MDVAEEKPLKLSVLLYVVVMVLKLGAWWWTGVMALLAEGLHTLSDIFVSGFLLLALRWSRREPDAQHPFGYGRSQYVGALVAAVLFISFTAFELYREGLTRLFSHEAPEPSKDVPIALAVLGASIVIGLWPLVALLRQKQRGAAARAQLLESVNDQLGLIAALVGTLLVQSGYPIADPIASLVVATIILVNGIGLFRDNLTYLLGRALPREELERLEGHIRSVKGVRGVHRLRTEQLAPESFRAEMHVEVQRGLPIEDANVIAEAVTTAVAGLTRGPNFVTVHLDPERPAELHPATASA